MIDIHFYLLAWFIPREAACVAATPNVPRPPRLLVFPDDADEGDCEALGEEGIMSANDLLLEEDFDDFFDDVVFELELDNWAGDVADVVWAFEPPRVFKFPYAADMLYNAVKEDSSVEI